MEDRFTSLFPFFIFLFYFPDMNMNEDKPSLLITSLTHCFFCMRGEGGVAHFFLIKRPALQFLPAYYISTATGVTHVLFCFFCVYGTVHVWCTYFVFYNINSALFDQYYLLYRRMMMCMFALGSLCFFTVHKINVLKKMKNN